MTSRNTSFGRVVYFNTYHGLEIVSINDLRPIVGIDSLPLRHESREGRQHTTNIPPYVSLHKAALIINIRHVWQSHIEKPDGTNIPLPILRYQYSAENGTQRHANDLLPLHREDGHTTSNYLPI